MSALPAIGVLGGGAWGLALAHAARRAGRETVVWARDVARVGPDGAGLRIVEALGEACRAPIVLAVVPAQALRQVAEAAGLLMRAGTPLVICAKGIERATGRFMSEVALEAAPRATPAALSGPSFAADVIRGLPTAVTVAAEDEAIARTIADAMGSPTFRLYHTTDLRGVEIGGAAKNVLAIAAGIVEGRGLGASAGAAMITRGFAELTRFGRAYGARAETLTGLSGLGDLVLTCSSLLSRNFALGVRLARGEAVFGQGPLAEGAYTAEILTELARARGVDMPIAAAVAAIVSGRAGVDDAIAALLNRPQRAE